ncbi:Ulp1 family isopeptidase [Legionella steelei]|nr:Ulp1 family isopeptidase [Legionella steelei]
MVVKYKPFDELEPEVQLQLGKRYRESQIDFDNSSIVQSATRVLKSLKIHNFTSIMVGPDRAGQSFNLANQLKEKKIDFSITEPRYVFFSLPTKFGEHSVAVVIDKANKKVHIMDSLGEDYAEAKDQISKCIEQGVLNGYKITCASGVQQKDKISCGVHSSANIIGVITGEIQPEDGHKLPDRSEEEVIKLTGLLSMANDDEAADKQQNAKESSIAYHQKAALKAVLLKQKQTKDVREFLNALNQEIPPDSEFMQRPLHEFLKDFEKNFPRNTLNAEFKKPKFTDLIKKYPPLDGKLRHLLENEITAFFHKKTNLEKLQDFFRRKPSPFILRKEAAEKEARKQIEVEISRADAILKEKGEEEKDKVRLKTLNEVAIECKKKGTNNFPCLEVIKNLIENKKTYIETGYEYIKNDPTQPRLLSINGIELHIDPYAPLNHDYSHVSLIHGLNGIIDSFISQYERAKKADLLYEWSGNFSGNCLDGRLECASKFLQVRDQPKMSLHDGMQVFLSEYAKDFAEEKYIPKIRTWGDLDELYLEYQTALEKVNAGQTHQMTLSHFKELFSAENKDDLERDISKLGKAKRNLRATTTCG